MQENQGLEKQKHLLERVFELFTTEGASRQTMEGIADTIGVSKRTLYKYFSGKEKLIDMVIQYKLESVEAQILALQSSGKPYHDRLIGFLSIVEKAIKPLANKLLTDVAQNIPWIWPKIDEFRHTRVLVHLEALLIEGSELGYLRSDLNPNIIAPIYIAMIEQIVRPEFILKQPIPPLEIFKTFVKVILAGILNEKGRNLFEDSGKECSTHD